MTLATADTIVLDPAAVSTDRTALTLTGPYSITEADYGNAEIEQYLTDQQFGSIPVGYRIPNRVVSYKMNIKAEGSVGVGEAVRKLQQKVARFQDEGGWLGRTLNPVTAGEWGEDVLYGDVVGASLRLPSDWMSQRREVILGAELMLVCLPDFYGDEAAGLGSTASSGDNDSLIFTEADIPGDYPARSRYTFTDTGSQARQAVLIASQSKTYDSAATAALSYEAEALTVLDTAAIVTKTGAHGGASNNAVAHTSIGPSWTPVLSTQHATSGHLTHWGTYRVYARCYATDAACYVRLEYGVGDATMRRVNSAKTVAGDGGFYIVDLGEVRLPKSSAGTQRWQGSIFAKSVDGGIETVGVDKLWLAPTESLSIVKARKQFLWPDMSLSGYSARDEFNQSAAALTGKTLPVGGTWAGAGDTDDFNVLGPDYSLAQRTALSDADRWTGRYAIAGTTTFTNVAVSLYVARSTYTSSGSGYLYRGLLARYTDTSNWLMYHVDESTGYGTRLFIRKRVAGTVTDILSADIAGTAGTLVLSVNAAGTVRVYFNGVLIGTANDSALATGGTLASGKVGIYDADTVGVANSRYYQKFSAWVPDVDAACLSGGILSVRHDGAERQTSTSGIYAPAHVQGSYPRAPASGLESRTCRTIVLPSAGDLDTLPDTDPLAFSVASAHRPCFLFAPEE